jgi:DNA/RNA endonuclease YhcR with UshA esterase domain
MERKPCFKDEKNFAIVINLQGAAKLKEKGIDDPATYYKGKTIRVRGLVRQVDGIPRIVVEDAAQITVTGKQP